MATWPATLPAPTVSGYDIDPVDQTIRTDMEVGSARTRRRTRMRLDMINVVWRLTDAQMAIFRAWFEDDVIGAAGGAGWFTVSLATGDSGITSREAKFNGAFKPALLPGMNWNVTAKLEVRAAALTADQRLAVILGLVVDGVYPSLVLPFADTKTLDSRITVTRASTATYFDANGVMQTAAANAPRFDHDPVTGASLGLLVEEARTNLLLNSSTLATQGVAVTPTPYTLSFYGTGTVTLSGASTADPLVGTGAADRVKLTFTPGAGTLTLTVSGSVTKAQIEAGTFATSYIQTAAAPVTRAADVAKMTGANFSSWYNASEGTLFAEYLSSDAEMAAVVALTGGGLTIASPLVVMDNWSSDNTRVGVAGVAYLDAGGTSTAAGTVYKTAFATKPGDYASSTNANTVQTSASSNSGMSDADALYIGGYAYPISIYPLNGHIKRLVYYPQRLTNAQLQAITA